MKFQALQVAYFDSQLVQPGDIVESDADLSTAQSPVNIANPAELAPIYARIDEDAAS